MSRPRAEVPIPKRRDDYGAHSFFSSEGLAGWPCPECGKRTSIVDARQAQDDKGQIRFRRRRVCPGCDHRFTTFEVSTDDIVPDSTNTDRWPS